VKTVSRAVSGERKIKALPHAPPLGMGCWGSKVAPVAMRQASAAITRAHRTIGVVREGRNLVGATGFEPATTGPPCQCATRLRHAPTLFCILEVIITHMRLQAETHAPSRMSFISWRSFLRESSRSSRLPRLVCFGTSGSPLAWGSFFLAPAIVKPSS
jgi:hypothetical protein